MDKKKKLLLMMCCLLILALVASIYGQELLSYCFNILAFIILIIYVEKKRKGL